MLRGNVKGTFITVGAKLGGTYVLRQPTYPSAARRGILPYFALGKFTTMARTIAPEEASKIGTSIKPGLNYLSRLRERMVEIGFLPGDPVFRAVVKAHNAAGELFMAMHYAGCGGVGGARMGEVPKS